MTETKTFQINRNIKIECEWKKTSYGFKHTATLFLRRYGRFTNVDEAKCCYYNRTWERFEFESVIEKVIDKTIWLSKGQKTKCHNFLKNYNPSNPLFNAVKTVALMGEIMGQNQKDSNNWKKRMLLAGLGKQGLEFPDDWEQLSEDEKTARLNKTLEVL